MPTRDYKEKLDNVRMIDEHLSKAVVKMTESLDEFADDDGVDNLLALLGASGDVSLLETEREKVNLLLKSTITDLKDTLLKKLRIGLKKDASLLNAICSQLEKPDGDDEKAKRDERLRLEKDSTYVWLKPRISSHSRSKVNLDALAYLCVNNTPYIRETFLERKRELSFGKLAVWTAMIGGDEPGTSLATVSISKDSFDKCNEFLFGKLLPLCKKLFPENIVIGKSGASFLTGYEFALDSSYAEIVNYDIDA